MSSSSAAGDRIAFIMNALVDRAHFSYFSRKYPGRSGSSGLTGTRRGETLSANQRFRQEEKHMTSCSLRPSHTGLALALLTTTSFAFTLLWPAATAAQTAQAAVVGTCIDPSGASVPN